MHVLFDLDGTLTDPKPGITRCIVHALESLGVSGVDPDGLGWCIGPPLRGTFGQLLGNHDPQLVARAIGCYRERFGEVGLFENEVYPGIPAVLEGLKRDGAHLYVATSKPEHYAVRIVEYFGLGGFFDRVVGSELDGRREPKAEVIAHVLALHNIDPKRAVMIGDRVHDVTGALENDLPCVGVLYGYEQPGELEQAGAWPLCKTPSEIPPAVRRALDGDSGNPSPFSAPAI